MGSLPACTNAVGPTRESAGVCGGSGWQPIITLGKDGVSPLVYRDGVIYYSNFSFTAVALNALPASGGDPTVLASVAPVDLWLNGDQLLYTLATADRQLFAVPIAGGSPQVVVDGSGAGAVGESATVYTVSATDFFWVQTASPSKPASLWRASLAGGAPVPLGTIDIPATVPNDQGLFSDLAVGDGAVLAVNEAAYVAVVPLDGSPTRVLPPIATDALDLAGLDAAGAYWSLPRAASASKDNQYSVVLQPADGGPMRELWRIGPSNVQVTGIWATGDGGWIAAVSGVFDDQNFHAGLWEVAADGTARFLGCSPPDSGGTPFIYNTARPAITPDAVYVAVTGGQTQIVRVPR